ncbi:DUF3857 domain-containing protein [uncultured Maribacter sp.]|uniref:DUF3857 domain-containing protein n=1 Tax=uncultured Maribacter sp. TaxID=431308 RepID=UPI0026033CB2|nr:DUF3857 domain-containing protein [uncultured Maribacter sp.]
MRFFLFTLLFLYSIFSFSQYFEYQSHLIDDNLKKNADAVVRLDEMVVDVSAQDYMVLKSKRVVTVLNKKGRKHVHAYGGYSNSRKLKFIKAVIYDAFGNELKKIREKDFIDVSAVSGGTLYSDYRIKYLKYTPTQYPYTVIFEKEIQTKNTAFIPSWYFMDGFMSSVEKNRFLINYSSSDLKPVIKEKNLESLNVKIKNNENSISYSVANIPAVRYENLGPPSNELAPKIMVRLNDFHYEGYNAHVENWEQLGSWMYNNILKGRDELPESVKQHVNELVKDADTNLEKAKIVYEYMQSVTRYISVQVGIGGIQPILASQVDRVKYGDCKGLSNYTHSLLDAVGVESYYVHVEAGRDKVDFDEEFPSLEQGNHAILAIPNGDDYTWIDCTSQTHPFGFVGDFTDDRMVLVMKPEGGVIVRTPVYIEETNSQKIEGKIELLSNGTLKAKAIIETTGIKYDNRFNIENEDKEEVLEHYQNQWSTINNLVLKDYKFSNNKSEVKFLEEVSISAENFSKPSGGRILFCANILNRNNFVPKRYRSRKMPFKISRGFLDIDSYKIKIPDGYTVESLPNKKEISSEFGDYVAEVVMLEDGSLKYEHRFLLKSGNYPKEKYNDYRNFRKEVSKSDNAQVVLIKKE